MRNLWPYAPFAVLFIFGSAMGTFVVWTTRNPEHLVRPDYYAHEVAYQDHIDRELASRAYPDAALARFDPNQGLIITPPAAAREVRVELYRPANPALDRAWSVELDPSVQQVIPASTLLPGRWRLRLSWLENDQPAHREILLQVPG